MSDHFHDPNDRKQMRNLRKGAPEAFEGFLALDSAALNTKAIPPKYAELIAIGVALTTQCPYCLDAHTAAAKKAGATEEEIAETVFVAAALRAGAAVTHGWMAMKLFQNADEA